MLKFVNIKEIHQRAPWKKSPSQARKKSDEEKNKAENQSDKQSDHSFPLSSSVSVLNLRSDFLNSVNTSTRGRNTPTGSRNGSRAGTPTGSRTGSRQGSRTSQEGRTSENGSTVRSGKPGTGVLSDRSSYREKEKHRNTSRTSNASTALPFGPGFTIHGSRTASAGRWLGSSRSSSTNSLGDEEDRTPRGTRRHRSRGSRTAVVQLEIATRKVADIVLLPILSPIFRSRERRSLTTKFHHMEPDAAAEKYCRLGEVAPSKHRGTFIFFATTTIDGGDRRVVMKQRHNHHMSMEDSLGTAVDSWPRRMEALANLPFSPYIAGTIDLFEDGIFHTMVLEQVDGTDLFHLFYDTRYSERRVLTQCNLVQSGSRRSTNVYDLQNPEYMELSASLNELTDKYERDSSATYTSTLTSNNAMGFGFGEPLSHFEKVKHIYMQLLTHNMMEAIGLLKSENMVHRDIKLDNVMICMKREVFRLIDFDTVVYTQDASSPSRFVFGTDQYIAPESYAGIYTSASDIFAVGAMLYKISTGYFAYPGWIFDDACGQNYVGHSKMLGIRRRLMHHLIDFAFVKDADLKDFIRKAMTVDRSRRLTIEEAMAHPFMSKKW